MLEKKGIQIQYFSEKQLKAFLTEPVGEQKPLLLLEHAKKISQRLMLPESLALITSGLDCIDNKPYELWTAQGEWQHDSIRLGEEVLNYSFNSSYLIGSLSTRLAEGHSLELVSQHCYEQILAFMAQQGKPTPLRMWNYFSEINRIDQQLERYQQFCVGRHNAFSACAETAPEYPASSAVGSHSDKMTILFIATVTSGLFLENPDQVSAYRYPREYSPKSPSFARASIYREKEVTQLYISGTASIVGHESKFHGDIINQTNQTLKNLSRLIEHTNAQESIQDSRFDMSEVFPAIKVYLRNPKDRDSVIPLIEQFAQHSDNICYLQADICRQELDIEIEMLLTAKNMSSGHSKTLT